MAKSHMPRPFGPSDKLGYLFGDFGNDFTFVLSTMILMKFYTDVMGVSAGVVGTVMMAARFIDAVTDVTMGRICDRARPTRAGKFKPWLLRMCVPVALASFLMYAPGLAGNAVAGWPTALRITYLAISYILWGSFCYTGINIPYGSMASAISGEAGDRQSLSTYRSMGGMLASTVIGIGLPLLAYDKIYVYNQAGQKVAQDVINGNAVAVIALVFSLLAVICYLLAYRLITERVQYSTGAPQKVSIGQMLLQAVRNRALVSIIAASVVMLLAQLTMQNMAAYLYPDYYNAAAMQSVSSVLMMAGMITAGAVAKPLALRFGKAEIAVAANLFAGLVCIVTWLLKPASVYVFMGLQALCWLGLGLFTMVSWALITDVIDYSQLKSGVREDGSVYALYSFARKLGQAVAAGLSGWLLTAIGYNEQALEQGLTQTPTVKDGIFSISTLVPAVGFIALGLILWFWYPLHKKQVNANIAALKKLDGRQ